jgi:hypothetical protein
MNQSEIAGSAKQTYCQLILRAQRVKWLKKETIPSISSQASTIEIRGF